MNKLDQLIAKICKDTTDIAYTKTTYKGGHLPEGCVYPDNFPSKQKIPINLTSEQYYEYIDIPDEPKDGNGDGEPYSGKGQPSGGDGQVLDDHSKWGESTGDGELCDDITKGMIEKSVSSTQKSRGDIPSAMSGWLDMFTHKRELDWKQVLRGIAGNKRVGSRRTIMRQDRRLPHFEWIKGRTKDRMFNLLVVSDVSGSVSDSALLSLWGEVRYICDVTNSAVDLIQVDTNPAAPEKLAKNTKIIERKACGGTNLHPALKMAKKHRLDFQAIVITTDGYLSEDDVLAFLATNKRVIWLIEAGGEIMDSMNRGKMTAFKLKA